MSEIWDMEGLSPVEKLSLLALADWANDDGLAWPSIKQIADKTGCSRRTVQAAFSRAEKEGLLTREQVIGKGCKYTIHPCKRRTRAGGAPVQESAQTRAGGAPNTPVNTIKKKDTNVSKKEKPIPPAKPDSVSAEVWDDWLAMRKAMKAPVSKTAINGIAREAERAGWPLEDALAECVARGWKGFKADWVRNDERRNEKSGSVTESAVAGAKARLASLRGESTSGDRRPDVRRIGQMPDPLRSIGHVP
ncbi:helix-turn-helix domain-containing protein [Parasphingorhabdus sp. JC815]|uniref:helix-turn-helix domain-containing protein n=1 Tax=Parasphingorhabdus sp. JC815 TaxID=3232140 RepID=UPI003457F211